MMKVNDSCYTSSASARLQQIHYRLSWLIGTSERLCYNPALVLRPKLYKGSSRTQLMDPNNPVVKLCVAGMEAEGRGQLDEARDLFFQAWTIQQDAFDACIAAHYVARHRPPTEMLHWNQVALDHALAVDDDRVAGFYPSLYLNLGWSHEQLHQLSAAAHFYEQATALLARLPDGPYAEVVRKGVAAGQARLALQQTGEQDGE